MASYRKMAVMQNRLQIRGIHSFCRKERLLTAVSTKIFL
jgi:hypothetical protein